MFKQRLITSVLLIPVVLLLILYATPWFFACISLLVTFAMAYEWLNLVPITGPWLTAVFVTLLFLLLWAVFSLHAVFQFALILGFVLWGLIILAVLTYPRSQRIWGKPIAVAGACLVILPLFFRSMWLIYTANHGKQLMLYLLFLVWAMDSGAYLVGKRYGAHRLIPQVSPGKTYEGLLGGLMSVCVVASFAALYFKPRDGWSWIITAMLLGLVSVGGDLFISMLKRRRAIKDTGALFPGHGGMLDRLDSLIAVAPFFYVALSELTG